jgi:hypothetical protein
MQPGDSAVVFNADVDTTTLRIGQTHGGLDQVVVAQAFAVTLELDRQGFFGGQRVFSQATAPAISPIEHTTRGSRSAASTSANVGGLLRESARLETAKVARDAPSSSCSMLSNILAIAPPIRDLL